MLGILGEAQGWEPRDRGFQRWPELGLSPTSSEAGRQSSDLTSIASQALPTDPGCRQALPRLIEQLVPSGQPETAHTPAHLG